ncbi:MAG: HEXXH motif domain-containing protein [Kibdelosporangium sp.]
MSGLNISNRDPLPEDLYPCHRMAWSDFDALARGDGGARVVRQLRRVERDRRLLLIRALLDRVTEAPPGAWELLARVEQAAPEVLELVLAHPYTGSWAGYATRLESPGWRDAGYVHALAAAAAIRAGIDFRIPIPVRDGYSILPTLGVIRLPRGESMADVHAEAGTIDVHSGLSEIRLPRDLTTGTAQWWGVRRIQAGGWRLRLDDLDPYRGTREPLPPQRLTEPEAVLWHRLISDAWDLIRDRLPDFAEALRAGFQSVTPLPFEFFRTPSASSSDAFGSAILGRPGDAPTLAAMIVHEFQHNRLAVLAQLAPLWEEDPRERFYAPWRDDPRPIGGFVQGLYAFFGVAAFWRETDRFEFAYHRLVTWRALTALRGDPGLTAAGRRFVAGIAGVLGPWQDEPVAAQELASARLAADDHWLGWRIRYLRPAPALVETLARAWRDGGSPRLRLPADAPPVREPDGDWSHARADLMRSATAPGSTAADHALVSGRFEEAARGYQAQLAADPDSPVALAGLALSTMDERHALRRCPELVRAVHRRIGRPATVLEVADWLDGVVG